MAVSSDTVQAVKAAIDAWIRSVEGGTLDLLPAVVAQDPDLVWIGGGEADWLVGYDALKQAMRAQNEALQEIKISVSDETIHVSLSEDLAWATNRWVFRAKMAGQEVAFPLRCTWVLQKRDTGWVLVHWHKSLAMAE